jgi:hypothetical protein
MVELLVGWHALRIFHDVAHLWMLIVMDAAFALVWFLGAGRTEDDGKTRVVTSVFLRFTAAIGELQTLLVFLTDKEDLLFVAQARPLWAMCAGAVLGSGVVLILWAVLSHFRDSQRLDILDASDNTAKRRQGFHASRTFKPTQRLLGSRLSA